MPRVVKIMVALYDNQKTIIAERCVLRVFLWADGTYEISSSLDNNQPRFFPNEPAARAHLAQRRAQGEEWYRVAKPVLVYGRG